MKTYREIINEKEIKKGDTVWYIGKGFIGFDPDVTSMIVSDIEPHDLRVKYKDQDHKLLVRKSEVTQKKPKK